MMAAVSTTTAVVFAVGCCDGARVSYTKAFCLFFVFVCLRRPALLVFYSGHVCCVLRVYCICLVSCLATGFVRSGGHDYELRLFLDLSRPEGAMYASVPKNV